MKKSLFLIIILTLCLTFVSAFFVWAEDNESEAADGDVSEDVTEEEVEKETVTVSGEIYYNRTTGMFYFPVSDSQEYVSANIMDGMVTASKVILNIPSDLYISVYRNGKEYTYDGTSVSTAGSYSVNCTKSGTVVQICSFTIVGSVTGKLEGYRMPSNFAVKSVAIDGVAVDFDRTYVDFTEEGNYSVEYCCVPTGEIYTLNIGIDHTAPTLKLEAVKNGSASGPVDISDVEKGAKLVVKRNGKTVNESGTLTKSGNYILILTDAAGNSTQYQFTIQVYFNTNSIIIFIIIILGIGALLFYIYKSRTGLKVR